MTPNLYDQVRKRRLLDRAWRKVLENGLTSKSDITRREVKEFALDADRHLGRITRQLFERRFEFAPSKGILAAKPGKTSKRPIVMSPISNRIVQRAILDTLQSFPPLDPYFRVETSFGGLKGKGVPDALKTCYQAIQSGAKNYIRSDIESFFARIPKLTIVTTIRNVVSDEEFITLFESAITTELSNLAELGKEKDAFPIYDIGVAQGSCLSPLLGNILLSEFDHTMNDGDITCYRYIDDFIILAPTERAANAAFKRGLKLLSKHGLTAYDPAIYSDKAERGKTSNMFTFLGCDIRPGMIRPNKKSQRRLIENIEKAFSKSVSLMRTPERMVAARRNVVETLRDVSNMLQGWGNQYSFCNDVNLMREIDETIDKGIAVYLGKYSDRKKEFEKDGRPENRRRLLGVHLLCDSKKNPIAW